MRTTGVFRISGITALLLLSLAGCGGKQQDASTSVPANETPQQAMQRRLNDPNVPAQEKDMIRKNMATGGASPGGTATSGGAAGSSGATSGQ